jgi:hypothetical protein
MRIVSFLHEGNAQIGLREGESITGVPEARTLSDVLAGVRATGPTFAFRQFLALARLSVSA